MKTVAGRTYAVERKEFPLAITIAPVNTSGNQATTVIVGHVREVKNGVEIDERDVELTDDEGIITYEIAAPQSSGGVEIVQTLMGFFASVEADNARFAVTITTALGERTTTAIRRPTFNPAIANLKFQI